MCCSFFRVGIYPKKVRTGRKAIIRHFDRERHSLGDYCVHTSGGRALQLIKFSDLRQGCAILSPPSTFSTELKGSAGYDHLNSLLR